MDYKLYSLRHVEWIKISVLISVLQREEQLEAYIWLVCVYRQILQNLIMFSEQFKTCWRSIEETAQFEICLHKNCFWIENNVYQNIYLFI